MPTSKIVLERRNSEFEVNVSRSVRSPEMISIVVPVYNEEEIIPQLHQAVADAMKNIGEDWEVVYVNDGSQDSSLNMLRDQQTYDSHIVVVNLSRNFGHMGALAAGLQTAVGDAIVLMDAD